jgi:hypothetical protein
MEQYLKHGNIFNALRTNLEGADHVEVWYKCLYDGKDNPVRIELNIWLTNNDKLKPKNKTNTKAGEARTSSF